MKSEESASPDLGIKRLIPQREPFIMVDGFEEGDGNSAITTLSVSANNYFILPDDTMAETGLIEHLAQSCAALSGYQALAQKAPLAEAVSPISGDTPPRIGVIGEVKHFECLRRPRVGERLRSIVTFNLSMGNVTLATGQTFIDAESPDGQGAPPERIADIQLKIFMQ